MMKKTILLLIFTFLFTACVERGYTPKPINDISMAKPIANQTVKKPTVQTTIKKIEAKTEKKEIQKIIEVENKKVVENNKSIIISPTEVKDVHIEEDDLFTFTDETKNRISGFFIIIIGIIILL